MYEITFGHPSGVRIAVATGLFGSGYREAIPNVVIEVGAFGFGRQQFPIGLGGHAEVTIDGPAFEFQVQNGALVAVGSGVQRGGIKIGIGLCVS